jgi:hypothetical protein
MAGAAQRHVHVARARDYPAPRIGESQLVGPNLRMAYELDAEEFDINCSRAVVHLCNQNTQG